MDTLPSLGRFVIPDIVVSHFHVRPGDQVADFGAGSGFFLKALSSRVGPTGRVYACEIQKSLVEKLGEYARVSGLTNVQPLWCDIEMAGGIKIPDSKLDIGIIVNTFFQFEDKETALLEMRRTLRLGGTLYIIDWTESFGGMGPQAGSVFNQAAAVALAETHGFIFERSYATGEHHYGIAVRKV